MLGCCGLVSNQLMKVAQMCERAEVMQDTESGLHAAKTWIGWHEAYKQNAVRWFEKHLDRKTSTTTFTGSFRPEDIIYFLEETIIELKARSELTNKLEHLRAEANQIKAQILSIDKATYLPDENQKNPDPIRHPEKLDCHRELNCSLLS